ncbi:MAG: beta-hydroxyacyl-ACP dehydratase [Deltaproteobacteria bacterium]|nr:beta-hydroxyacyl-ACP dehydratase [Deltaproteobacteria bacterium]
MIARKKEKPRPRKRPGKTKRTRPAAPPRPRRPALAEPASILRHRPPLLLVDSVTGSTRGRWLVAAWSPKASWPVFRGHFPEEPIVPGLLLVEAIAQASALLAWDTEPFDVRRTRMYLVTVERARFLARVGPRDELEIRTDLVDRRGPLWRFDGSIACRGQVVADARIVAALLAPARAAEQAGGKQA